MSGTLGRPMWSAHRVYTLLASLSCSHSLDPSDAANRSEHERKSRRMLDNIQHRRRPTFGDSA